MNFRKSGEVRVATKPGSSVFTTYGVKVVSTLVPKLKVSGAAPMGLKVVVKSSTWMT